MAKATVEMTCPTCGKTYTWSATKYNRREADSWEAWAASQERECPECYAVSLRKARDAEAEKALEEARKGNRFGIDIDAIDFKGSEKQNAWAKKILAQWIKDEDRPVEATIIRSICSIKPACKAEKFSRLIPRIFSHERADAVVAYFNCEDEGVAGKVRELVADYITNKLTARDLIDNRESSLAISLAIAEPIIKDLKTKLGFED